MNLLKRVWGNIKWLLNHPPVSLCADADPEENHCDYCASSKGTWATAAGTICYLCQKRVYDKVLGVMGNEIL